MAPSAGGDYSIYTNSERDGTKQWEKFFRASSQTGWLSTRDLLTGGHGVVTLRKVDMRRLRWPPSTRIDFVTRARCTIPHTR